MTDQQETLGRRDALRQPDVDRDWCVVCMKGAIIYLCLSALTLPFITSWWIGEIPPLALVQGPKIIPAAWLRAEIVLNFMVPLGISNGSYSPDSTAARPYALAIVYCVPLLLIMGRALCWRRGSRARKRSALVLLVVALADYGLSLAYLSHDGKTLY